MNQNNLDLDLNNQQPEAEGDASQRMRVLLNETLNNYPGHYTASQMVLAEITQHQKGWRCYGAMETGLSFDGMEVTFDYRLERKQEWRRILVMVTLSNGELTFRNYREMAKGQHSGIMCFEEV